MHSVRNRTTEGMEENKGTNTEDNSLENLEESSDVKVSQSAVKDTATKKSGPITKLKSLVAKLNVYFLLFIMLVIVALMILFIVYNSSTQQDQARLETQELTQDSIDELVGSDAVVGDPKQLLTVESDSVFNGQVLIRDGLDVAGPIKVGGSLSLPGITVSGQSAFDEVTVNRLSIAGDAQIQGQLSVQQGLSVSGPVTFSGTLSAANFSIQTLTVEQDARFNRHIDAAGPTPGVARGGAVGSGGTVTISGTDTAGTVGVNVGGGAGAGNLATITFANAFSGNPHVVITPVAPQGSSLVDGDRQFYISSRSSTSFTIAVSDSLPSGSISFDYIVID